MKTKNSTHNFKSKIATAAKVLSKLENELEEAMFNEAQREKKQKNAKKRVRDQEYRG